MLVPGFTDAIWSAAGCKPAQEVYCSSLKASALQVPIVPLLESPKESNAIIHSDFKLYGKTSG